jgi:hypothetical protein
MANTLLTPQIIAQEALAILRNQLVMAELVHTDYANEFVKVGDTITVRKPATLVANDFAGAITSQDLTESGVTVTLDKFKDVSVALTSKQESLELRDFARQVIEPAMVALAQQIDQDLAQYAIANAGSSVEETSATPTNLASIAGLGKALDIAKAPLTDRHLVMSPEHKYRYALTDVLTRVNYAGSNETLRDAMLGKVYGLQTYMDQNLSFGGADYSVAFHKNAFAFVIRPLDLPMGAARAAVVNGEGLSVRVVYGYNQASKTDTISFDVLYGIASLRPELAIKLIDNIAP